MSGPPAKALERIQELESGDTEQRQAGLHQCKTKHGGVDCTTHKVSGYACGDRTSPLHVTDGRFILLGSDQVSD